MEGPKGKAINTVLFFNALLRDPGVLREEAGFSISGTGTAYVCHTANVVIKVEHIRAQWGETKGSMIESGPN